jgi:hypothetical protein
MLRACKEHPMHDPVDTAWAEKAGIGGLESTIHGVERLRDGGPLPAGRECRQVCTVAHGEWAAGQPPEACKVRAAAEVVAQIASDGADVGAFAAADEQVRPDPWFV